MDYTSMHEGVRRLRKRQRSMSGLGAETLGEVRWTFVCNGAGAIAVPNPSFEDPIFTGGVIPATGWTANNGDGSGGVDVVNFTDVEFGDQYHWLNLPGFGGPDPSFTESNPGLIGDATVGTYTVTVSLGHRTNDATTDGSITVELLADGNVIGTRTLVDPNSAIPVDTFSDFGTEAVVSCGDAAIGGDLTIRVSATLGSGGIRRQAHSLACRRGEPHKRTWICSKAISGKSPSTDLAGAMRDVRVPSWRIRNYRGKGAGRVKTKSRSLAGWWQPQHSSTKLASSP